MPVRKWTEREIRKLKRLWDSYGRGGHVTNMKRKRVALAKILGDLTTTLPGSKDS